MSKSKKFSPETRERAVRIVQEQRKEYPSLWATVESLAPKVGCTPHTLHEWVKKHELTLANGIGSRPRSVNASRRLSVRTRNAPCQRDIEAGQCVFSYGIT